MNAVKTIIIDDSAFFRTLIHSYCDDLNLPVVECFPRGDTFLDKIKQGEYQDVQLLLLDINLPGKSGRELLVEILDELPELIIIMVSSLSSMDIVNECLAHGATNYINKDAGKENMESIIRSTLEMNGL